MRVNRVLRRWVRVRGRTVPAGVALGALLVTAVAFAGAVGIDPLPGFAPPGRPEPASGPLSALQPEVSASLLATDDLPPGYTRAAPAPSGAATAGDDRAAAGPRAGEGTGTSTPGAVGLDPWGLLPDLPGLPIGGGALDVDGPGRDAVAPGGGAHGGGDRAEGRQPGRDGAGRDRPGHRPTRPGAGENRAGENRAGENRSGEDRAERHRGGRDGRWRGGDRRDGAGRDGGGRNGDDRAGPDRGRHRGPGRDRADRDGSSRPRPGPGRQEHAGAGGAPTGGGRPGGWGGDRRCGWLVSGPWALAARGNRLAAPPRTADHVDPGRGVRLRQAVGGFDGDGAARAMDGVRGAAAACRQVRLGPLEITLEPVELPGVGADDSYAVRLTAVTGDGRGWRGYLAVDRVGPVLSMLWHVGPDAGPTAAEVTAARRAAVAKAHPLAGALAG